MSNYTDWQMEFIEKPDLPKWVRVMCIFMSLHSDAQMLNLFWD